MAGGDHITQALTADEYGPGASIIDTRMPFRVSKTLIHATLTPARRQATSPSRSPSPCQHPHRHPRAHQVSVTFETTDIARPSPLVGITTTLQQDGRRTSFPSAPSSYARTMHAPAMAGMTLVFAYWSVSVIELVVSPAAPPKDLRCSDPPCFRTLTRPTPTLTLTPTPTLTQVVVRPPMVRGRRLPALRPIPLRR